MKIISNGSKWYGQAPDSAEKLIEVLATDTLDPKWRYSGSFIKFCPVTKQLRAFGNFLTCSHAFNISGTIDEMRPIARAIKHATRRPEYLHLIQQLRTIRADASAPQRCEPLDAPTIAG